MIDGFPFLIARCDRPGRLAKRAVMSNRCIDLRHSDGHRALARRRPLPRLLVSSGNVFLRKDEVIFVSDSQEAAVRLAPGLGYLSGMLPASMRTTGDHGRPHLGTRGPLKCGLVTGSVGEGSSGF